MKKILILSANPINTNRLRLDEEVREIRLALKRAQNREAFQLIPIGAARIDDLRQTLLDNNPQIVHFSGHGTGTDGLVLENTSGESQVVSTESLSNLFELFKDKIECVLLNACYSEIQASAIHRHIDCVIGMAQPIQDDAAINFSKGFYDAIFSGRNYADSFRFGCNNIDLNNIPKSHTPTIKIRHKDLPPPPTVITNTHKLVISTAVFGLSAGLVGLVQLAFGNAEPITNVLLAFGSITLWVCFAYIYCPSSRIFGFGVALLRSPKQYKRLRRLALAGMIIIPILSTTGFYVWQLPSKDIIVLIAEFKGEEPEKYRVTEDISNRLYEVLHKYPEVKVQRFNNFFKDPEDALDEGKKHKATIVIWGDYGVTDVAVQISSHFEVLNPPKDLPDIRSLEQIAPLSELKTFKLQTRLSSEMVYLSLFTVGLTRYTARDWDQAINNFNDALVQVKDPINELEQSIVYFYRGNAYAHLKEYDRAIVDFTQAIKFDPHYDLAYYNRGNAYAHSKDYNRAIADSNQAIKLNSHYSSAYDSRGYAYFNLKDYDRAIVDYTQAIKFDPKDAYAYRNRGNTYLQKKDYDHAIVDYTQAIQLNPKDAYAYNNRGYAYIYKGDYNRAITDSNQAIQLNPKLAGFYDTRCEAYVKKGDYDHAITDCNQAIKLETTDTNSYYNRGIAYKNKGSKNKAVEDFKKVLEFKENAELNQNAKQQLQELGTK